VGGESRGGIQPRGGKGEMGKEGIERGGKKRKPPNENKGFQGDPKKQVSRESQGKEKKKSPWTTGEYSRKGKMRKKMKMEEGTRHPGVLRGKKERPTGRERNKPKVKQKKVYSTGRKERSK